MLIKFSSYRLIGNGLVFIDTIGIKYLGNVIRLYYIYFIKVE